MGNIFLYKLSDSSLRVVVNSLNAIFDVYNDTKYNDVISQLGMIAKLQIFVNVLDQRVWNYLNILTDL